MLLGVIISLSFCCCQRNVKTICGVPVKGTPWELAAAIHDRGDGSFWPETVYEVSECKAYIVGEICVQMQNTPNDTISSDDGFIPAEIVCDVQNGQVVDAVTYCKQFDGE